MEPAVIVITGPTCSGKTYLSLLLARQLETEIISADSRQIYKYLDIGTAKPEKEELNSVKHYFIDELLPDEEFNVSRFETDTLGIISRLHEKGKIPVVAGGSGLYIKAAVDGIFNTAETSDDYRAELMEKRESLGNEYLYEELKKVDPVSAESMLPQNWKRVIRALEVFHLTGKSILEHHRDYKRESEYKFIQIGLNWDREILYRNIETRVDKMMDLGLVDETSHLLSMGYSKDLNSLNTVGYKEIISYLDGEYSLERAVELIKRNTRRFAKRQMTWFRADKRIKWFNVTSARDIELLVPGLLKL